MTRLNFADAMNTKLGDIERPANLPQGTYVMMVAKQPVFGEIASGKYDTCDFMMKPLSATDDVDADELKDFGDITAAMLRHRFMFNSEDKILFQRSLHNMRVFMEEHLQIEGAVKKETKQNLAEAVNHQCLAVVTWRPDPKNPDIIYQEIKATAPVA